MRTPTGAPIKVAVLGAGGTIAPAIVHDLAQSPEIEELQLLDLDGERAAAVASAHGAGKASSRVVDARAASELGAQLATADVLVNTASYRVNLDAMRACLHAGCDYIDLGGLYRMTLRQLELGLEFERAGLLALLGVGSSPGKTNLMAAHAVAELGGVVESIEICAAGRDPEAGHRFSPPYALQTLLDELTLSPIVTRDGVAVQIEPLAVGGAVDFGEPIGVAETIYTLHSELATFGESFGARDVSFRLSLAPALLERLEALKGENEQAIAAATREAVPASAQTVSVHLVIVNGAERSIRMRAVSRPWFGLGGSIVSTAAPAAAAVRLLARGELTATGALPPERCLEPAAMFAELEARGCSFTVSGGSHRTPETNDVSGPARRAPSRRT